MTRSMRKDDAGRERGVPTAAVICGSSPGAYDIVRSIGRAGIGSVVFSPEPADVAFCSRHTRQRILLPEFREENFEKIFERVRAFNGGGQERPVLFYVGNSELMFVARFRDRLEDCYRFLLPPSSMIESLMNKALFADLARQARLPVPPSRAFADAAELESEIHTVEFPCIVKPTYSPDWYWETEELRARFGSYKQALQRFDTARELLAFCAGLPPRSRGFVVQSYIDGPEWALVSFHGYFDEESRCLGRFLTREIRTNPPGVGLSGYCRTFHDEGLIRLSVDYLQRLRFRGVAKIDYKWDEQAGEYKMLEIEPHYQPWHLLGAQAGANLALLAYRHQRGERIEAQSQYGHARLLHFSEDFKAYWRGYRKTKEWTWAAYLKSLLRKNHYRIYDPADPIPFVYAVARYIPRKCLRLLGLHGPAAGLQALAIRLAPQVPTWVLLALTGSVFGGAYLALVFASGLLGVWE